MLTKKQHELLVFINARLEECGISPSFDEMKDAVNLKSKSGVHRLITALEERGFIRRLPHRARALEVMKLPESSAAMGGIVKPLTGGYAHNPPNVIAGNFPRQSAGAGSGQAGGPISEDMVEGRAETISLPLYGRIAAGDPIEAVGDNSSAITLPADMIGAGEHYALEVTGDSMIEAGIHDGDVAVIERCEEAENGTIVVALIEGEDATLKRLRKRGATIALEPANPDFETRIFGADQVRLQGRLIALMRKY